MSGDEERKEMRKEKTEKMYKEKRGRGGVESLTRRLNDGWAGVCVCVTSPSQPG